jgi:hypothetical protein
MVHPQRAVKEQMGSEGLALLFLSLDARSSWTVVAHDPADVPRYQLYRRLDMDRC